MFQRGLAGAAKCDCEGALGGVGTQTARRPGSADGPMSSSDDEPDWLQEQASARKEKVAQSRLVDAFSDDSSPPEEDYSDKGETSKKGGGAAKGSGGAASGRKGTGEDDGSKGKGKGRAPPSSRLPLILAPKVRRDMLLLETGDTSVDLSGDFGCIGKLHVKQPSKASSSGAPTEQPAEGTVAELRQTLMLDLKGKVYDADIVPCNSVCLLAVDGSKAKVEAVFSDFVQLAPPRDSIFEMKEVLGGELGADFFDDGDDNNYCSNDDEEELGPLKERRGGGKMPTKKKGGKRKPASKAASKPKKQKK